MHTPRVLIVDDDVAIIKFLRANLKAESYQTFIAMDGANALETFEKELPDLLILDLMLPKVSGFDILGQVRQWSQIPIMVLSALDDERDKIRCLDLGADYYVTKPFGVSELIARVKAVFRRTQTIGATPSQPTYKSGALEINFAQRRVIAGGEEVKLTPTEYSVLQELALNAGKVLTHSHLLNRVWGLEYREEREYVHVFIRRLRAKLEPDPTEPEYITTIPGVGYRLKG